MNYKKQLEYILKNNEIESLIINPNIAPKKSINGEVINMKPEFFKVQIIFKRSEK